MSTLYVAMDVGSKHNSVAYVDQSGKVLHKQNQVLNNLSGLNLIWQQAENILSENDFSDVLFGMESSGPYWLGPYWSLQSRCASDPQHFKVHALNPQIVAGFKDKFPLKKQKTDNKDAISISRRMRFGEYETSYLPKGDILALRTYTRHRFHLVATISREKARFLSILCLKFNEYKRAVDDMGLFYKVFSRCATALATKYPSCEALANASIGELIALIKSQERSTVVLKTVDNKYEILQYVARNSYPLPEELIEPVSFTLSQTLDNINFLEQQKEITEKMISSIMDKIDDPAKSIKGLGPVFSAGIIAETPDPKIYNYKKGHASLASYLGIIPSMNDSGEFKSSYNRMTKTGNPYGRYYYIESARLLAQYNPVFKQYYDRKIKEAHLRRYKRTIGLVARKFIRIYYHLKVNNLKFRYV